MSEDSESSRSQRLLEASPKLVSVTETHPPPQVYANLEMRLQKMAYVLESMEGLKIHFQKEHLVG